MNRRYMLSLFFILAMLLASLFLGAGKASAGTWEWIEEENGWYYLDEEGARQTGWVKDDGSWYYLDESGRMQTGWLKYEKKWYHLNDAGIMKTGWYLEEDNWYFFNQYGIMQKGWVKYDGKWYYLNKSGVMQTGWITVDGRRYYLKPSGAMTTGWYKEEGSWYFFNASGAMQTGWVKDRNKWYFLNSAGIMQTGWVKDAGNWYYLKPSGVMMKGWYKEDGNWYYLNPSGIMQKGWTLVDGSWYYLKGGKMQTGWLQVGDNWYFLKNNGAMFTGWKKFDGKWYYFNPKGIKETGFVNVDGKYYFLTRGAQQMDGYMVTGTHTIGGRTCVFGSNGVLQSSTTRYQYEVYLVNPTHEVWCDTWNAEALLYIRTDNPDPSAIAIEGFSNVIYEDEATGIDLMQKCFGIHATGIVQITDYAAAASAETADYGWDFYKVPGGYFAASKIRSANNYTANVKLYEYLDQVPVYSGASVQFPVHGSAQDTAIARDAYAKKLAKQYFGDKYQFTWEALDRLCTDEFWNSHYPFAMYPDGSIYHIYKYYDTEWGTYHVLNSVDAPLLLSMILDLCNGVTYKMSSDTKGAEYHAYLDVTYKKKTKEVVGFCPFAELIENIESPYVNLNAYQ